MRVVVRHGHFAFYPNTADEVLHFRRVFNVALVREEDYFTFAELEGLPRWSQIGRPYGTLFGLVNYEGRRPWDVMAENDFVYSLATGLLIPAATVATTVAISQTQDMAVASKPLIQPGSILSSGTIPGNVLLGYTGELQITRQRLYIDSQETLL